MGKILLALWLGVAMFVNCTSQYLMSVSARGMDIVTNGQWVLGRAPPLKVPPLSHSWAPGETEAKL